MANYEIPILLATVSTAYKTAAGLQANARRAMVYEVEFGQNGALASSDCQMQWDLSRFVNTNSVTATATVAQLLDLADVAASTLAFTNVTGAVDVPNLTGAGGGLFLKNWGINQRGSYRWRALDDGDNIIIASTASQGIAIRVLSSGYTSTAVGNLSFIER